MNSGMHSYAINVERLRAYMIIGLLCAVLTPYANNVIVLIGVFKDFEPWISAGPSFGFLYGLVFVLYNKFAWKISALQYIGFPAVSNLNGKYQGELVSSYKNKKIPLEIEVVQDWTKMVVYTTTAKETSHSYSCTASQFDIDGKSTKLSYSYTNYPFSAVADKDMQQHDGTANLVFRKDGSVKGTYFNARKRYGTITLKKL